MKKIICLLTAALLILLAPLALAEGDMEFVLASTAAQAVGDTVTVTGAVRNAPVCASFRVVFTYDKEVLEPIEGKKADAGGLFMINVNAERDGKAAVNALSADAQRVLEGDMTLFKVSFKVLRVPEGNVTPLTVVYSEFYTPDLKAAGAAVQDGAVTVGTPAATDEEPSEEEPAEATEEPLEEKPEPVAEPTDIATAPTTGVTTTGSAPVSTEPTGTWLFDEEVHKAYHVEDNGDTTEYTTKYNTDPSSGKVTEVELTDEAGTPAGTLTVEEQPGGSIIVTEQKLAAEEPAKAGFPWWIAAVIAALVLIAAAVAAFILLQKKKKSDA